MLFPSALYPNRSYHREPSYQCRHCKALFWYGERNGALYGRRTIAYNKCCKGGKVFLSPPPPYKPRPEPLVSLARFDSDAATRKFMENIRQYNWLFAFTSMGAHVDNGCGPPVFKISGYLLPLKDETPKFLQLYIYDTSNEVRNRLRCPAVEETPTGCLEPSIVDDLRKMLNHHNPFVKKIRLAKERLENSPTDEFIIRIICAREGDPVQYNLPSTKILPCWLLVIFHLITLSVILLLKLERKN
jgi:hypothetical protein